MCTQITTLVVAISKMNNLKTLKVKNNLKQGVNQLFDVQFSQRIEELLSDDN